MRVSRPTSADTSSTVIPPYVSGVPWWRFSSGASRASVIRPSDMRVAPTTLRCSEWPPSKSEDATTISLPTGQSPTPSPRTRMFESPFHAV